MGRNFKEIRNRYDDVVCGVTNDQMVQDVNALLGYIDQLHQRLVEQAAEGAVQAAFRALEDGRGCAMH